MMGRSIPNFQEMNNVIPLDGPVPEREAGGPVDLICDGAALKTDHFDETLPAQ